MFESVLSWFKKKNFVDFSWIKKAQFIELDNIDVSEDPVRPELDLDWRKSYDRKIYGLEYNNEIEAIMCLAFTNDVPHTVRELDLMSKVNKYEENADTIIAYTVWSKKKGGGKLIVKEVFKKIKKSNHLNRLVTLSPLTEMATTFHKRNGAKLVQINENTQNFEYKVI